MLSAREMGIGEMERKKKHTGRAKDGETGNGGRESGHVRSEIWLMRLRRHEPTSGHRLRPVWFALFSCAMPAAGAVKLLASAF